MYKTFKNYILSARFIACIFFICNAQAKIVEDKVFTTGYENYTLKSVCEKMLKKEVPLVEIKNIQTLDCMGEEVKVYKFCEKELKNDPSYIRAVISKEKKQVHCKKGTRVELKLTCNSPGVDCKDIELSCFSLKNKFAGNLKLIYSRLIPGNEKQIACHFSRKKLKIDLSN